MKKDSLVSVEKPRNERYDPQKHKSDNHHQKEHQSHNETNLVKELQELALLQSVERAVHVLRVDESAE